MSSEYNSSTEFLQSLASAALLEAENTTTRIWNLTDKAGTASLRDPQFAHSVVRPSLSPPPQLSDVLNLSDTTDASVRWLDGEAQKWLDKYFPSMDACLSSLPEDFLCGILSNTRPFGLDETVFELVWQRARDRAYRAQATEESDIIGGFAARGFTLPPGAMAARLASAAERAADAIAAVNVEQAIKDAEIKLELMKFAAEQALNYKRGILSAMADFMRLWVSLPDKDMERARLKAQAMGQFYSALSSYYNVEVAFEELSLKAKQATADVDISVDRNRIANANSADEAGKAAALGQAARAFADISSQAANSAGTLVAQIESL